MHWADIKPGAVVYHRVYTSYGRGVVVGVTASDWLEHAVLGKRRKYVVVRFEHSGSETNDCRLSVLCKSPNRKKIKEMVDFYTSRGTPAEDGGDRLIFGSGRTA